MSRFKLDSEIWVPAPLAEVWAFAQDVQNLLKLTPPFYRARIEADGPTRLGAVARIHMAPLGIPLPLVWVSKIEHFNDQGPVKEFTDIQSSGPFKYWKHRHTFESGPSEIEGRSQSRARTMTPGTWIKDHVEYELFGGAASEIANKFFARKNLEQLFAYRRKVLQELFSSSGSAKALGA